MDITHYWHITLVTHNSRVSERMVQVLPREFINGMTPFILGVKDQLLVAELLGKCSEKYGIPIITFNVLPDHVHLLVKAKDNSELAHRIGNMKGYIAHIIRKKNSVRSRVWARKFSRIWIQNNYQLQNVINYIDNNHLKHESSWGRNQICGFTKDFVSTKRKYCTDTYNA